MSRRHDVLNHLRQLREIGEILRAMKNLATVEARKMERLMRSQLQLMEEIRSAAAEFYLHFPELRPASEVSGAVLVAVGSERGFCGDFNEAVLRKMSGEGHLSSPRLVCVGTRLAERLPAGTRPIAVLPGPGVVDEVGSVVARLVKELSRFQLTHPGAGLNVLYHDSQGEVRESSLLPFLVSADVPEAGRFIPPLMNLEPDRFLAALTDEYVFGGFYEIFYDSLASENQQRMEHLQGAVERLEEKTNALARQSRALRQEEITQEIQLILLSAGSEAGR